MPSNKKNEKEIKSRLKIIILVFIGIIAFIVCIATNIKGLSQVINKESDMSGTAGLSVRQSNFLKNSKETKNTSNKETTSEKDILVNSLPLIKLNNNSWNKVKAQFSEYQTDENGNMFFSDGYTLYCNGKCVNYAVFSSNYEDEIIGHIKVGEDFKQIEKTLGTPTTKTKDYLEYKTRNLYVFFYEDEVCAYPNRSVSNKNLEELFKSYFDRTYGKDRSYFLADIRNNYEDFKIEIDEEADIVTIISTTRQVVANLDNSGAIQVEFYNGYKVSNNDTKEYIEKQIYKVNNDNLVEIAENERVNGK